MEISENDMEHKIAQLEKEIVSLEEIYAERVAASLKLKTNDLIKRIKDECPEKLKEVCYLEDNLQLNSMLTNIKFEEQSIKTLKKAGGDGEAMYLHSYVGLCGDMPFAVNMEVLEKSENQDKEDTSSEIVKLDLKVDREAFGHLASIIPCLEKEKDIQGFFNFIRSYVEEVKTRQEILTAFKKKFDSSVKLVLPAGADRSYVQLINPNNPREKCKVFWDMEVSSLYRVTPHIYLKFWLRSASDEEKEIAEKMNSKLAELFQKLLKKNGIEHALRIIFEKTVGE